MTRDQRKPESSFQGEYSVIIRTVGNKEYLVRTLDALMKQKNAPDEIVVVVPHGVTLEFLSEYPVAKCVGSEKGMVEQRLHGIKVAKHRYALLMDDDIVFHSEDDVGRILGTLREREAQCVVPFRPGDQGASPLHKFLETVFLIAVPSRKRSLHYNRAGGYVYPDPFPPGEVVPTEGGNGGCIAIDREWVVEKGLHLKNNILSASKYPLREDGVFIMEILRAGGKAFMVGGVQLEHIGMAHKVTSERLHALHVASMLNNYIFWKEYIYEREACKLCSRVGVGWMLTGYVVFGLLRALRHKQFRSILGFWEGIRLISKLDGNEKRATS